MLRRMIPDLEVTVPGLTEDDIWLRQQCALCTYKEEELSPRRRFAEALVILEAIGLRDHSKVDHPDTIPETLGLGGAVYKRRWDHGRRLDDLHLALFFTARRGKRTTERT